MSQEPPKGDVFSAEMLVTVGHEFRGPLTTIQGYAMTLLRHGQQLTPAERQEFLRAISEASAHLGQVVARFLELAYLETRTHPFPLEEIHLPSLVQEAMLAVRPGQAHRLLLVPALKSGPGRNGKGLPGSQQTEMSISGNRRLLRLMLDLLLENALLYSSSESLVEVSLESISPAAAQAAVRASMQAGTDRALIVPAAFAAQEPLLALHIRDHGIGISPEHLSLIFQRFYRVDTRLTREINGLGLGLALCKAIVTLHRGMLWVESTVGEGSTFSLVLPCQGKQEEKS